MLEASKLWARNPLGPNIHGIYIRLRDEAIARGEIDVGGTEPRED